MKNNNKNEMTEIPIAKAMILWDYKGTGIGIKIVEHGVSSKETLSHEDCYLKCMGACSHEYTSAPSEIQPIMFLATLWKVALNSNIAPSEIHRAALIVTEYSAIMRHVCDDDMAIN